MSRQFARLDTTPGRHGAGLPPAWSPIRGRRTPAAVIAALFCLAGACAFSDRAPYDAAQQPAWPPGQEWRIEPEPALVIGAPGGADGIEFYGIATALMLSDGRIAVAERSSQRIRLFDRTGRQELPALGGRGRGPGEFTGLTWIGVFRGDSIVAWDSEEWRATVFAPSGEPVRTTRLPAVDGFVLVIADLVFPDGSLLVRAGPQQIRPDSMGESWGFEYFGVYRAGAESARTIGVLPVDRCVDTNGPRCRTLLFGPRAQWAAADGRLYFGTSVDYTIRALDLDGGEVLAFGRPFTPRRVSGDDVQRATRGRPAQPGEERAVAEWLPAYDRMLADAHGNLWVREYGTRVWSVFEAAGRWLGDVEAPRGLRVHQIAADHVVGVMRDSLDVESVAVHRLVRPVSVAAP